MRVIIRFSVDGEKNSALRNKINTVLNNAGFRLRKHTATYEHKNLQTIDLGRLLRAVWNKAYHHQGPGQIDHFWMYSDR